jgi:hypothetical protein
MKVQSKEMLTALAQHKQRRQREQQKVPADELDSDCDPPEDYRELGDERRAYANSVGMRLYDK